MTSYCNIYSLPFSVDIGRLNIIPFFNNFTTIILWEMSHNFLQKFPFTVQSSSWMPLPALCRPLAGNHTLNWDAISGCSEMLSRMFFWPADSSRQIPQQPSYLPFSHPGSKTIHALYLPSPLASAPLQDNPSGNAIHPCDQYRPPC